MYPQVVFLKKSEEYLCIYLFIRLFIFFNIIVPIRTFAFLSVLFGW